MTEITPLQAKLEIIAANIGKLGLISAVITVLVMFIRFWIEGWIHGLDWKNEVGFYL